MCRWNQFIVWNIAKIAVIIRRRHDARAHLALSTLMLLVRLLRWLMPTPALYLVRMCLVSSDCGRGLGPSQTTPPLYRRAQVTCRCPLRYAPLPPACESYRLYDNGVVCDGPRPRRSPLRPRTYASVNGSRALTTGAARPSNINLYIMKSTRWFLCLLKIVAPVLNRLWMPY